MFLNSISMLLNSIYINIKPLVCGWMGAAVGEIRIGYRSQKSEEKKQKKRKSKRRVKERQGDKKDRKESNKRRKGGKKACPSYQSLRSYSIILFVRKYNQWKTNWFLYVYALIREKESALTKSIRWSLVIAMEHFTFKRATPSQ